MLHPRIKADNPLATSTLPDPGGPTNRQASARSRALKAEYTMELAQDLKAVHGLDAETELANIL